MQDSFVIYRQAVQELCPDLTDEEWDYFYDTLCLIKFPAKHFFIQAGTIQRHIGFVIKGLLRGFYINDKGQEITTIFVKEGEYATDYPALITKQPALYYFQCLEETELILLNYEGIQTGYEKYKIFNLYGRLVAEEVIKMLQGRIQSFQFQNAEERYLEFIETYPDLFNRVSLTHLATYLGIERPSLSRIRKKLAR